MIRPLELYIGLRYTRAKRRNHFISFISLMSLLGIALGVMALIVVLSVMNGFVTELRARILGVVSHVTVTAAPGEGLADWQALAEQLARTPQVRGVAPYVDGQAMLQGPDNASGVLIRGVLPSVEPQVSDLGEKMVRGSLADLQPGAFGVILGRELAASLGVNVGDKVTVLVPQANVTPAGLIPRLKRCTVVGLFEIGMYEYDSTLALMHVQDAALLSGIPRQVSGVRLKLDDLMRAPLVTQALAATLPVGYYLSDWTRQHVNFFRAVQTEKRVMAIILSLIVAVAAFNLVSMLVMVVTDKRADIAILRTLGASPRRIMGIFMVQGTILGVVGTVLGIISGVLLALNVETIVPAIERLLGANLFPADIYYISKLPAELHWNDVGTIAVASFLMSVMATLYPAWHAARIQPAEALRYE